MAAPFLVFSSVGDRSRHPLWLQGRESFDLWLVYYGSAKGRYEGQAERYWEHPGGKWPNLARVLESESATEYEAVFVPDDDLQLSGKSIDRLFQRVRAHDLWLAQPAFTWESLIRWNVTMVRPWMELRYTNFVENGAAVFSRSALERCRDTFCRSVTGAGLDFLWPHRLGYPNRRIAVLDAVPCTHPQRTSELDRLVPRRDHEREGLALLAGLSCQKPRELDFRLNPAGLAMVERGLPRRRVRLLAEQTARWIRGRSTRLPE